MKWKEAISLLVIAVVAIFCIQVYIKRGVQGRLKLNDGEEQDIAKWNQLEAKDKIITVQNNVGMNSDSHP